MGLGQVEAFMGWGGRVPVKAFRGWGWGRVGGRIQMHWTCICIVSK